MPNESEIIKFVRSRARQDDRVVVGVGDDAAVIKHDGATDLIACCDLMVEGVHFRREWHDLSLIGHKALAVTLSDVAAMGGMPRFAMVSIALPSGGPSDVAGEVLRGLFDLADASGVKVIGGDTSSSPGSLFIDTSVIGECAPGKAVTRAGASAGDRIYVTGTLGASALGLRLLESGSRLEQLSGALPTEPALRLYRQALLKHLAPKPQLTFGHAVGGAGLATAMIDISDGLSTDLWHIIDESRCGAVIRAGSIPIAESVMSLLDREADPLRVALGSGEEYELLLTARPEEAGRISELSESIGVRVTEIGEITGGSGLHLERNGAIEPLPPSGYEHMI